MKNVFALFALFLCILSTTGCRKNDNPAVNTNNANVMFVNVMTNGNLPFLLDGHIGDSAIASARGLGICGYTAYNTIPVAANAHLSYWVGSNKLVDSIENFVYNDFYSAFICGTPSKPKLIVVQDFFNLPAPGYASIRFLNFCPGDLHLDCYVNNDKVDTMLGYIGSFPFGVYLNSGYAPVNIYDFIQVHAGTAKLIMQNVANTAYTAVYDDYQLLDGAQYTAICTDTTANLLSTGHHLKITMIHNH